MPFPTDPLEGPLSRLSWLLALARLGSRPEDNATQRRKIAQVNVGVLLALLTNLAYNLSFLYNGNAALLRSGLMQLPMGLLMPIVWRMNAQRRLVAGRWWLCGLVLAETWAAILGGQGTVTQVQLYFVLFAVLMPALFPIGAWRSAVCMVALDLACYAVCQIWGVPPHPALAALAPAWVRGITISMMLSCGLMAALMAYLTELASAANEGRLQRLAATDALTGLHNRRHFVQLLEQEAHRAAREGAELPLAVFDIDYFKQVNDDIGHAGGDQALQRVATVARASLRPYDALARIGGEEFAVLLPGASADEALNAVERFRRALSDQGFEYEGQVRVLTASIGLALLRPGQPADAALRRADAALYRAKREGRNRVCVAAADERMAGERCPLLTE